MIVKTQCLPKHEQRVPFVLVANQRLLLMPLGDIHFMAKGFPADKLRDHIAWGLDRGAMFLGMGEYLDFASQSQREQVAPLRDSVREQLDNMIMEQADELYQLLKPTEGRWLGLLEGDHRWDFVDGTSVDQYIAKQLRTQFLGTSALIRLKPNDEPRGHPEADTVIYCHHGIGSSRAAGGHLNRVEDLLKWIAADIYLMGHSHAKVAAPIDMQVITPDGKHHHRTKIIARTGAWLCGYASHEPLGLDEPVMDSRGSYVEQKAYPPASLGGLCIGVGYEKIKDSAYYRPTLHVSI